MIIDGCRKRKAGKRVTIGLTALAASVPSQDPCRKDLGALREATTNDFNIDVPLQNLIDSIHGVLTILDAYQSCQNCAYAHPGIRLRVLSSTECRHRERAIKTIRAFKSPKRPWRRSRYNSSTKERREGEGRCSWICGKNTRYDKGLHVQTDCERWRKARKRKWEQA